MTRALPNPVVHLELQTGNLPRACAFYTQLFGWHVERIEAGSGSYLGLALGDRLDGGVVERDDRSDIWLPYVEVPDVAGFTVKARKLGAAVTLAPREGPAGWRSIVAAPACAEIALWQPKT